ncbi:ketosteroid isomerase-like protein [Kribbella sp. VKM Ac-2527]|uniref:Ketosteroid isomerase-like protein n=1 Tax=Kribbella caucasensis TaxID=2512215 RepID=A0A4V3C6E7_9ACTN|nr:nuclear transport factor 2 family protein [Kribbella sp. VKM Ac-2527]TDO33468.1 ketosteroid isomerase-like protein [Kribbella sp. VKM Ac-2527]
MAELEATVRRMMTAFDQKDWDTIRTLTTEDAQGVDEVSRRWLRGAKEIDAYYAELSPLMGAISSELNDVHELDWGDTGLVTCWLEQDYEFDGRQQHVSSPTTVVLRKAEDQWQIALMHTIPLPEEE